MDATGSPGAGFMPDLLFVYGTLAPKGPDEAARDGWVADAVRGRMFDLGPYPALVGLDGLFAGWVEGYVRPVDSTELIGCLDPYEGVGEGQYRRESATTREGRRVWVYVYNRPIPPGARGPLSRWEGRRGERPRPPSMPPTYPRQGDD